jgi:hypothetical protein
VISMLEKKKEMNQIPTEYRPVSLLDTMYKIYTTWLYWMVKGHVEEQGIMSEAQMGGQKGIGTSEAVYTVMGVMEDAKQFGKPLHLFAADIVKAFDSIEHWAIRQLLEWYGINKELVEAIMGCYEGVKAVIKVGGKTTSEFEQTLIFNLAMNPGLEKIRRMGKGFRMGEGGEGPEVAVVAYVDDDTIVGQSMGELEEMVGVLGEYYEQIGLENLKQKGGRKQ